MQFRNNKVQELKDIALELDDKYVLVHYGNQEHTQIISVREQLQELKGRQNQMIAETFFVNSAFKRYNKLKEQKSAERKQKRTKRKKIRS